MKVKDIKMKLELVTDIVTVEQQQMFTELMYSEFKDLVLLSVLPYNEYDVRKERGDGSTHVYFVLSLESTLANLQDTLDVIVANMRGKDSMIQWVQINDKIISRDEISLVN